MAVRTITGLTTLQTIRDRLAARPAELIEARKNGQKVVGWQGYNMPEELFLALGLIPIHVGAGGDDRLVELGSRYISTKNCVYVRETLGLFAENKDVYIQNTDFLALDATCLQTYRTAELLEYYFDRKVAVLSVPRNFYWEEARRYFARETESFVTRLEELSGSKLDSVKLEEAIDLYAGIRDAIVTLYDYQAAENDLITWEEVYEVVLAGYFLDKREYLSLLEALVGELRDAKLVRIADYKGGFQNGARIFLSGSVIPPGDHKLIDIIGQVGGRIVGDDLWSGLIPHLDVRVEEKTPAGLALAYIGRTPHGALPYLDLKTDPRLARLQSLISHFKASGVIYHTLRYCDPYTFKAKETKDVLAAQGIPLLEIHTEYAGSDLEAIRTRVEAFVEILEAGATTL